MRLYYLYKQQLKIKIQTSYKEEAKHKNMKKIVFVQKQQSSTYDPVSTFFANSNKKAGSLSKPPSSQNQQPSSQHSQQIIKKQSVPTKPVQIQRPISTNKNTTNELSNNKKYEDKQKPVTSKIGRKGQYNIPPPAPSQNRKKQEQLNINRDKQQNKKQKQESIYGVTSGNSKKNIRNYTNQANDAADKPLLSINQVQKQQSYFPKVNQRRSPIKQTQNIYPYNRNQQNLEQAQPTSSITLLNKHQKQAKTQQQQQQPPLQNNNQHQQILKLKSRVKQLQQKQQQINTRIYQMQQKQQKYTKMQQKYNKLLKQHKLCAQNKEANKKSKEKQEQIKKILSRDDIAYNKKREIMLMNQLNNIKKINRQLVTRIKNYRGTDLVQLSLAQNKTSVLFKQYDHSVTVTENGQILQIPDMPVDVSKIQTLAYRIIQSLDKYVQTKINVKKVQNNWVNEKKTIIQISQLSKQLSLQCLNIDFKIPKDNKQCANMYNQIQKYRNMVQPVITKYDLNFIITQQNIQLINKRNQQLSSLLQLKQNVCKKWNTNKKFKKPHEACQYYLQKYKDQSNVYTNNASMNNIIVAHCLAQIQFMQNWTNKMLYSLKEQLKILGIKLKQLQELASLKQAGKESLCAYVWDNINQWTVKIPDLQMKIRNIGEIFKNNSNSNTNNNKNNQNNTTNNKNINNNNNKTNNNVGRKTEMIKKQWEF